MHLFLLTQTQKYLSHLTQKRNVLKKILLTFLLKGGIKIWNVMAGGFRVKYIIKIWL